MQSEMIARLKSIIADAEADMAEQFADAETTGERADLADTEVCLLIDDAKAIVAALSAAEPIEPDENPMRFFADNVDKWGELEWFNRMVDACEEHDRKRIQAFRCEDLDEKDMLSLSADTSKMIMSSSAFQLARNHKDEIRSALSAQVQDVAGDEEWQTVPKHPTGKMIDAVVSMVDGDAPHPFILNLYRAMLAVAPAKQEGGE